MSEQDNRPSDSPKNHRTSRVKSKGVKQSAQQITAVQSASSLADLSSSSTSKTPLEERWGEFPSKQRQTLLWKRLQMWEQEPDYNKRPGPFTNFKLTGADTFWLAALVAGEGNTAIGKAELTKPFPLVALSELPLQGADLMRAQLQGARLNKAQLQGANLSGALLQHAALIEAQLQGANLVGAQLQGATLIGALLQQANLNEAHLQHAKLREAQLQGANLVGAQLQGAELYEAQLQGADLSRSDLRGVDVRYAQLDTNTQLSGPRFDNGLQVAEIAWNNAPLIQIEWEQIPHLGDEVQARQSHHADGDRKELFERVSDYLTAARAYRRLAVALRGQGITEVADRFTYRALIMQRKALWYQMRNRQVNKLGAYLFSVFLATLTGYGFRMWRIFVAYALLITGFASAYHVLGNFYPPGIPWNDAFVLSITAFHGRVFSSPFLLGSPQGWVAALEAILGLIVEGVFIAMLTQRFFNR